VYWKNGDQMINDGLEEVGERSLPTVTRLDFSQEEYMPESSSPHSYSYSYIGHIISDSSANCFIYSWIIIKGSKAIN
jgi:hypothetical protein